MCAVLCALLFVFIIKLHYSIHYQSHFKDFIEWFKTFKTPKTFHHGEMWVLKVMDKFASMVMGKITSLNFVWCLVRKASLSFMIFKWSIVRLSVVQQHSLCLLHDGCTARPRLAQSKNILILIFTISFSTNLGHIFLYS